MNEAVGKVTLIIYGLSKSFGYSSFVIKQMNESQPFDLESSVISSDSKFYDIKVVLIVFKVQRVAKRILSKMSQIRSR